MGEDLCEAIKEENYKPIREENCEPMGENLCEAIKEENYKPSQWGRTSVRHQRGEL